MEARVERADVPPKDRSFLLAALDELTAAVSSLSYPLDPCVTHGDAHVQNLMITGDDVELIDFERVAWGQPEWDLSMTATEYVTAQFWTTEQYRNFVASYGFDVLDWQDFSILRRVQEVKMTTWLMQNIHESSAIRDEYDNRMATIRAGRPGAPWRAAGGLRRKYMVVWRRGELRVRAHLAHRRVISHRAGGVRGTVQGV